MNRNPRDRGVSIGGDTTLQRAIRLLNDVEAANEREPSDGEILEGERRAAEREMDAGFTRSPLDMHSEAGIRVLVAGGAVDLVIGYAADRIDGPGLSVVWWPYRVSNQIPVPCYAVPNGDAATAETWTLIHNRRNPAEGAEMVATARVLAARARFLCYKGDLHRLFPGLFYSAKETAAREYFHGSVPFAGGAHHALIWGRKPTR